MSTRAALPKVCIALGLPTVEKLLDQAEKEVAAGEQFLEFRLDYLTKPEAGLKAITAFTQKHPDVSLLVTCRRHQNHGKYNGVIDDQMKILDAAIDAGAHAIDVEVETAEKTIARCEQLRAKAHLIVSWHNYEGTPPLEPVLRRMMKVPADAYKVVTTARKPSDASKVLALQKAHPKVPMILLAMGEVGFATRVLCNSHGGIYTYAAPNAVEGTAAGQVGARLLRQLYRIDKLTKSAKIYGVVADPVRHSLSPTVHNRAFQARRLDAVYLPFLVKPTQLKDFLTLCENLPVQGFSVTLPHKQRIMRYLDVIDPLARRIGAVNTVWKKAGKWRGTNTDAAAVTQPLGKRIKLNRSTVLLVGNGGAARGAAFALADAGAKVVISGRNPDRVRALSKMCGAEPLLREQLNGKKFDALVHATPMGMWPNVKDCFFDGAIPADVTFDMVYNPLETELLRRAKSQGGEVIPGLEMFLTQAAQQFEIWMGESAPHSVMEKAALEALK
ncbi:shikimate dehydrogenase [Bryobacter aggregatus]|uniref:shikimate dehydrogenase n=1 Tax=Bryobacter aggregatus TaxID=360054 RepID=UPI0004E20860|nr:shikimate dehydrogenase [Bryobacter aggregatus]